MLSHDDIWRAIDKLAQEHGLTPSGLARRAGLDATTFNRSKRMSREGKLRWPSTESVAKVLDVTNCSLAHLVELISETRAAKAWNPPLIEVGRQIDAGLFGHSGRFDMGAFAIPQPSMGRNLHSESKPFEAEPSPLDKSRRSSGKGDAGKGESGQKKSGGAVVSGLPDTQIDDPNAYFLRITESGYEPYFRAGDILIASPSTPISPGCFVLACMPDRRVHICQISAGESDHSLVVPIIPILRSHTERLPLSRCEWVVRIVWSSK